MLRLCQYFGLPDRFHKLICKVTMSQEKVILQGPEVIKQPKFVEEYVEQTLAGYSVGCIYRALEPKDVAVL